MTSLVNNAKDDIIYFKDEVLKDVKKFEAKINQKIDSSTTIFTKKLDEYDIKMAAMTQKIGELENKVSANISLIEKVQTLSNFKIKTEQDAMVQEIRLETIENDLKNAINKYDAILLETVIYSGVIGQGAKFKNFHELLDYLLNNVSNLNLAKEKSVIDIKTIKKKNDSVLEVIKSQINSNSRTIKEVNKKLTDLFETKSKQLEEGITQKFVDLKMNNNKYANELKDKAEKLGEIFKQMEISKVEMEKNVKKEIDRIINIPGEVNENLNAFQDEIGNINNQFLELSEFVKNYKFEGKIVEHKVEEKKEEKDEETKTDKVAERKRPKKRTVVINKEPYKIPKPISLLKQYIDGEISYEAYTQKSKLQLHNREEVKVDENKLNDIKNDVQIKKKVMSLASQAEIVVVDNNTNIDFYLNNDYEALNNNNKQEMKVNLLNPNITKIRRKPKVKENEKELKNNSKSNNNNDMDNMIKLYNLNQNKLKKSVETSNKANNTSFQDYENSSYKIDDIVDKEFYFNKNNSANSSPKKSNEFNEDEKNKSNDIRMFSNSLYLEEKKDSNIFGSGSIEVINYNKKREKEIKDKKMDLLEYIRKSYDDQEINDEKKLDQLNNAINFSNSLKQINNINRINNFNNSKEFFNSTVSNPIKKNMMKKIFNKKIYPKNNQIYNNNNDSQSLSLGFINEKKSEQSNIISLEKINLNNNNNITNRKIFIDNVKVTSKMLNPIKLKGSKSCTNINFQKQNENEINKNENKIGQLVDKIKDMIPYEEKLSFFETSNIDNLNRNVFSKKKIFFEKKEENYDIKSLPIKKLNSVYHHEPKIKNNNFSKNLIMNEN